MTSQVQYFHKVLQGPIREYDGIQLRKCYDLSLIPVLQGLRPSKRLTMVFQKTHLQQQNACRGKNNPHGKPGWRDRKKNKIKPPRREP